MYVTAHTHMISHSFLYHASRARRSRACCCLAYFFISPLFSPSVPFLRHIFYILLLPSYFWHVLSLALARMRNLLYRPIPRIDVYCRMFYIAWRWFCKSENSDRHDPSCRGRRGSHQYGRAKWVRVLVGPVSATLPMPRIHLAVYSIHPIERTKGHLAVNC